MRVAVVTDYFPTSLNQWAGHSAYQTLRLLAKRCDLHVFYPESSYPAIFTPPTRAKGQTLDRTWSPADVSVTYIPYLTLPVVSRPINGFVSANRLLPHVRKWQPDIIFNYVIYPNGHAAVRIAHALGISSVLTAIGSDLNRIADPLCAVLTRSTLRQASYITTVSQDLCNTARLLGASPDKSGAILNGCDTQVFHPSDRTEARSALGLDPNAEIVLYVGRLDIRKGLMELIEAIAILHPQRPRLQCFFVGDGPNKLMLVEAVQRHNLTREITFIPSCLTAQVAQWMAAADLVTLPSYKEGCPNVILEALSAGRPVVAANVGGIPELMDASCGRLVPPMDIPALSQALNDVLDQAWDAAAISVKHSRSWSDVADDVYAVLEQTLL